MWVKYLFTNHIYHSSVSQPIGLLKSANDYYHFLNLLSRNDKGTNLSIGKNISIKIMTNKD
jgi:hypothetical protein